ncbi:MAG: hypothetical protein AB7D02_00510 [Candidatus Paceibacterota bacterium]
MFISKVSRFFKSFWGGLAVAGLMILAGYLVYNFFNQGTVSLLIISPDEAKSGELKSIRFQILNNSNSDLEDTLLTIKLPPGIFNPEDFSNDEVVIELGKIDKKSQKEISYSLLITGENNTLKTIEANFRYRPKNISAYFEKNDSKNILINGSLFKLSVLAPNQVFQDQNFPLVLSWSNPYDYFYENVEIRATWPPDFSFQESNPNPVSLESNNIWSLGVVNPGAEGKINIKGVLSGQAGEAKRIIFSLGINQNGQFFPLVNAESVVSLVENPLKIYTLVNGATSYEADLGEELNFSIFYQNNYSSSLRNVKIKVDLSGDVFDYDSLKAPKGLYSKQLKQIVWDGLYVSDLYNLVPGESGSLSFTIKLKKDWPMISKSQQNPLLEVKTTIESGSLPEGVELTELPKSAFLNTIKVNTQAQLVVESYHYDYASGIANTGNLPLRVDQPTDFTIHFKIKNSYNALNNVIVQTTLPYWVEFTQQVAGNYGANRPSYDPLTRTVVWDLNLIEAGSGILDKGYEAIFQIRVTPPSNFVYQPIPLTGEITFRAIDSFTGKAIEQILSPVMSNKLTDQAIFPGQGIVQP